MARQKHKRKTFHASVQVTRIEDWCVEAESEEEARALLASGAASGAASAIACTSKCRLQRMNDGDGKGGASS